MPAPTPTQLKYLHRGDKLKAEDWNAAVRFLRELSAPTNQQIGDSQPDLVWAKSGDDEVPPWSVFSVSHREEKENAFAPIEFFVEKICGDGSPLALYTNGSLGLSANSAGNAWRVGSRGPARIKCTGGPPKPGGTCGPDLNEWGVTDARWGLLCLALDDSGSDGFAWVVPADCGGLLVKLTEDLDAYDRDAQTLGNATAHVLYRDNDDMAKVLKDPASETGDDDWEVTVYSAGGAHKSATILTAMWCPNVGLVAQEGESGSWIEFALTAALAMSATTSADADVTEAHGFDPGDTVTLQNTAHMFHGPIGAKGRALYSPEDDEWEIIALQGKARYIEGTLSGAISGGAADISVSVIADGLSPGSTVSATFNGVFTGSSGLACGAVYVPESDSYRGVWVQCP